MGETEREIKPEANPSEREIKLEAKRVAIWPELNTEGIGSCPTGELQARAHVIAGNIKAGFYPGGEEGWEISKTACAINSELRKRGQKIII